MNEDEAAGQVRWVSGSPFRATASGCHQYSEEWRVTKFVEIDFDSILMYVCKICAKEYTALDLNGYNSFSEFIVLKQP